MRPPPPEASPSLPPFALIEPVPLNVTASMRTLPPAPPDHVCWLPFALIVPSSVSVFALMRTTPPPALKQLEQLPSCEPEPPGSFGSYTEPYVSADSDGVWRPPRPPWLPPAAVL